MNDVRDSVFQWFLIKNKDFKLLNQLPSYPFHYPCKYLSNHGKGERVLHVSWCDRFIKNLHSHGQHWFCLIEQVAWSHSISNTMTNFRDSVLVKPKVKTWVWTPTLRDELQKAKEEIIHRVKDGVKTFWLPCDPESLWMLPGQCLKVLQGWI